VTPSPVTYESTLSLTGQRLGKGFTASTNARIRRIVSYTVLVLSNKSKVRVIPRTSCFFSCAYPVTCLTFLQFWYNISKYKNDQQKQKQTPLSESASELYRLSDRRLSVKRLPTFADKGCHVVSVTNPFGRILGFLDTRAICDFFKESVEFSNSSVEVGQFIGKVSK
jgi:hypothetical protein